MDLTAKQAVFVDKRQAEVAGGQAGRRAGIDRQHVLVELQEAVEVAKLQADSMR